MLSFKWLTLLLLSINIFAQNHKLRELIEKVYGQSDSAELYFIEIDDEFLIEFMKTEVFTPISTFNADFTDIFRQRNNIFIVFQVSEEGKNFSKLLRNLIESVQIRKFVIISAKTLKSLIQYFYFFAENKFTRIFGIIDNTSSYAYLPYADQPVQQIVDSTSILPDALKNLNGFALRTSFNEEFPRTFRYPNKKGQKSIGGQFGQIIVQFLKRHNATYKETLIDNSIIAPSEISRNLLLNNEIDLTMNVHSAKKDVDISYPVTIEEHVIMVPVNGLLSPHEYFQRPFQAAVWMSILFFIIFITVTKMVIDKIATSRVDIWSSFSDSYLTMLNLPTEKPITSNYRFYLVVFLFAFIIGRLYGTYFQSFLTVFIKIKQFETIQDLIDSNIPVMISIDRWEKIKNNSYPEGLEKIILPTNFSIAVPIFMTMRNTSYAYVTGEDRCQFYIGFQSLFRKSLFRRAQETINSNFLGYMLPHNSPFKEILNQFIIEIRQTGLMQKWDSDVVYQAKAAEFGATIYKEYVYKDVHAPLKLYQLQFAWKFLMFGLNFQQEKCLGTPTPINSLDSVESKWAGTSIDQLINASK
ncbi:uncharacterized protein LOC129912653 [Episyrphus balteatus]|uniref:uncharacterized protein LOC129912653 n=1 Tax=Episyrphus balteatus TaxID=286459 RepID=UPI002486C981|nr:uncharacterized protein LOC129912653 [Episyrphus balteatus]